MKKIPPTVRSTLAKPTKKFVLKDMTQNNALPRNGKSVLERVPEREFIDYSTEEMGYYARKDSHGKIINIIKIMFPR